MSMELMVQAMKVKVGNPLRKLVLLKLADNASDQGECWPSYQHIADQCEISRRSVMNHINALCLSGLMIKETRTGPKGNTSNFYQLTLDGASNKQGIVQHIHHRGEGDSLGGGAGDSPRISHSFEPVKEPENTSCPNASLSDGKITKVEFWKRHPKAVVFSPRKSQWGSQEDLTCAKWIWARVLKLYEQADIFDGEPVRPKEPNWTAWANDIRLMRMLDGRTHKQVCELFRRVQGDPFWSRQVKCPSKLREKWDDLVIRLGTAADMAARRDVNYIPEPDNTIPAGFRG